MGVAGLDVHRDTVVACCQVQQPDRTVDVTKQSFSTTAKGLGELAAWLSDAGVETVAMEATGVYWKPVYYCLEGLFDELWLCNAQHVKNVPGRKTDLTDAEWLTADVTDRLCPFESAVTILCSIPGVSTTTAEVLIAEMGVDMTRFPTSGHLCAWAGVAPASHESAGKRSPAGTRKGSTWLQRALVEAARGPSRTKGTYLSAQYSRIARRRGPNKAAIAVAHSILDVAWHLLSNGALYDDPGARFFELRHDPAIEARRLQRRIEQLGFEVSITPAAA
jgi:transposase